MNVWVAIATPFTTRFTVAVSIVIVVSIIIVAATPHSKHDSTLPTLVEDVDKRPVRRG
jgi:hypothetical protein